MNILGRVMGGILIFISVAWLASIAQVFPFMRSTNQFASQTGATPPNSTGAVANNGKNNQRTAAANFAAPRGTNPVIAQNNSTGTTPATTTSGTAGTTTTAPVAAGW